MGITRELAGRLWRSTAGNSLALWTARIATATASPLVALGSCCAVDAGAVALDCGAGV